MFKKFPNNVAFLSCAVLLMSCVTLSYSTSDTIEEPSNTLCALFIYTKNYALAHWQREQNCRQSIFSTALFPMPISHRVVIV